MIRTILISLLISFFVAKSAHAQMLDGVVAVVGDELILKSDVDLQLQYYMYQNQLDLRNKPEEASAVWKQLLDGIVNDKIMLTKAKLDSIPTTQQEIDGQVVQRFEMLKQRVGTDAQISEMYGKSIPQLRADIREDVKSRLMVEGLRRKKFGNLSVSNEEVNEFYKVYKDSLPPVPAEVELAHVVVRPKVDVASRTSSYDKIDSIYKEIKAGGDFAALAKKYSEDPGSAQNGGDLGFFKRGELVKPYEEAAFSMREKQISKIVETIYGFHIIQLLERRGESIRTRHILIKFDKTKLNDEAALAKLNEVKKKVEANETSFGLMARITSEDDQTAQGGGDIISPQTGTNRLSLETIKDEATIKLVNSLKVGEISEPQRLELPGGEYAFRILLLKYKASAHPMNLEQDYSRIRGFALQKRQGELYQEWISELRNEIYWKVKL